MKPEMTIGLGLTVILVFWSVFLISVTCIGLKIISYSIFINSKRLNIFTVDFFFQDLLPFVKNQLSDFLFVVP